MLTNRFAPIDPDGLNEKADTLTIENIKPRSVVHDLQLPEAEKRRGAATAILNVGTSPMVSRLATRLTQAIPAAK